MPQFTDWLSQLLEQGVSAQTDPPTLPAHERPAVGNVLNQAFDLNALDVAGPPIPFDRDAAINAAEVFAWSCWYLVSGEFFIANLRMRANLNTPAHHLSVDVAFRFLPSLLHRAKARDRDGELVRELDRLARAWPLSGVLVDLGSQPQSPLDFGGHSGLQMLYAERLIETGQPGWIPTGESARDWVEHIFRERGKPLPATIAKEHDDDG